MFSNSLCALEEAAKKIGLDPGLSKRLAIQTVIGSAKHRMFLFSREELRDQVTSPNGTTQAALEVFHQTS